MYKLPEEKIEYFLNNPEFGMGYQLAQIELNGALHDMIILNAELMLEISELPELSRRSIEEPPKGIIERIDKISKFNLIKFYEPTDEAFLDKTILMMRTYIFQKLIIKIPVPSDEKFKRFSPYRNDKRINGEKLLPGSYATTNNDARFVPSGLAAVGRFALLSPFPAIHVFNITLHKNLSIEHGTVRPNYNQAGGGVEVLFNDEASHCTVSYERALPIG